MYYTQKHATSPGSWPAGGRLFATTIALVTVAVIAAGCSSSGSDTKPGPGAVDPASGISEATMKVDQAGGVQGWKSPGPAFDVSQAKGKTVYFVGLSSAIPVVQTLFNGMKAGLDTVGVKSVAVDGKGKVSEFNRGIEQAISQKADAIVLEAIDTTVVTAALADAKKANIPVIVSQDADSVSPLPANIAGRASVCYSCVGSLIADWVIKDSGGKANATIFVSNDTPPSAPEQKGMVDEFKRLCGNCNIEVENVAVADWQTRLPTLTSTVLQRRPNTNYVIPLFDGMATFVTPAIQSANKAAQVKVASFNATPSVMEQLARGEIVGADVGNPNVWWGWAIADQALRLMTGQQAVKDENIPTRLFTRDNIKSIDLKATEDNWYGPADFRGEYQKLWKLG